MKTALTNRPFILICYLQFLFKHYKKQNENTGKNKVLKRVPANPIGGLGQVHVQSPQQQIDVMDPQIYTERDDLETLNTHLTQQTTTSVFKNQWKTLF